MQMKGTNGKEPVQRTHVAFVLDESGSMQSIRGETIDAFNQQVVAIRETTEGQEATVSLVKFNTIVPDPVYWTQPVERMQEIDREVYRPNGMTAMLDAIGLTVDRLVSLPDAEDENTSFLVVIISDGQENNSKRFSSADIAERIQRLDATDRWTFTYLGANQDLAQVQRDLRIPAANTSAFEATAQGIAYASGRQDRGTRAFMRDRAQGKKSKKDFYLDDDPPQPPTPPETGGFWDP
jgi:uncharacterized protein YegL